MRILFLAKSTPVFGGVERWLADLAAGLLRNGHECIVALAKGSRFHDPKRYQAAYPELETITLDGTTGSADGRRLAVRRALRRIQPDAVIPVMLADALSVCAEQKKKMKHRILYPVHEICDGVCRDLERYGSWMDRVVFVDFSGIANFSKCCSENEARQVLIPCGVPTARRLITGHAQDGPLQIGFCGRLETRQKRVGDLVDLCGELEKIGLDYRLTIVGEGPARDPLANMLSDQIFRDRVVIREAQSRDELYQTFYPGIDVLLVLSDRETGPLVAFEAMMNGCVVLTSDFSGRKENGQLRDGENCLVFPVGDMRAAAALLEKLQAAPAERVRLADRAREFSVQHRSLAWMVKRWESELTEVMSSEDLAVGDWMEETSNGASRLESWGVSAGAAEMIRVMTNRRFTHASAGEEWPRYSR
jgi:glycosyltransferase involved in cell wall biosynthesis